MPRPEFVPVFTESATAIKERMLSHLPDTWRKEKGDFIHDAIEADPPEIVQLEMALDDTLRNAFPAYCDDEYMDMHMETRGIPRTPAIAAVRRLEVVADAGVRIPKGYTVTSVILDEEENPIEYTVNQDVLFSDSELPAVVPITCKQKGEAGNLPLGSEFILQPPIAGVQSVTDAGTLIPGAEKESVESAYSRLMFKAENPDTGGNQNDYKRWVLDEFPKTHDAAVGKCRVLPLWNGNGTVKVVIVGTDYKPATGTLMDLVQAFLDPLEHPGEGAGKAPCGAVVTVQSAEETPIVITANVAYLPDADVHAIKAQFETAVTEYLKTIVLEIDPNTNALYPVSFNKIGALLIAMPGVSDYSNLMLNGAAADVHMELYRVPTLQEVTLS